MPRVLVCSDLVNGGPEAFTDDPEEFRTCIALGVTASWYLGEYAVLVGSI